MSGYGYRCIIANEFGQSTASNYATLTVAKANPTFPTSATITYGQTLADAVFTGGSSGIGTFAFTAGTTKPTVAQSGTPYEVKFTPTDAANYNTATQNVNITVNKSGGLENDAPPMRYISASNTNEHDYELHLLALNKDDPGDNILASAPRLDNGILYYKGNGKTSGTATQIINIVSENYIDITATITFEATAKEELTINVAHVATYPYDGTPKSGYTGTPTALPYTDALLIEYAGTNHPQSTTPPTNVGKYTVKISLPDDAPYIGVWSDDFTIAKAKIDKPTATTASQTFTGSELSAGITANAAYTVTGDKQTTAGTHTATVALKDKDNYEWADGTTTDLTFAWTINADTPIRNTQLASRTIKVQTIGNYIVLENLPQNAKVDVYNLQWKLIFSSGKSLNRENRGSDNMRIQVQTKGMYIVKIK